MQACACAQASQRAAWIDLRGSRLRESGRVAGIVGMIFVNRERRQPAGSRGARSSPASLPGPRRRRHLTRGVRAGEAAGSSCVWRAARSKRRSRDLAGPGLAVRGAAERVVRRARAGLLPGSSVEGRARTGNANPTSIWLASEHRKPRPWPAPGRRATRAGRAASGVVCARPQVSVLSAGDTVLRSRGGLVRVRGWRASACAGRRASRRARGAGERVNWGTRARSSGLRGYSRRARCAGPTCSFMHVAGRVLVLLGGVRRRPTDC